MTTERRLYISGIGPTVTPAEMHARLSQYGSVVGDVSWNDKDASTSGAFLHCTMALDAGGWSRLRRLSGTTFKGGRLSVAEARPDWRTRWQADAVRKPASDVENARVERERKKARTPLQPGVVGGVHSRKAAAGRLMKDGDIQAKDRRYGWIKGRYGRAIAVIHDSKGNRIKPPADALLKLWGSAHPQSWQLTASYDSEEEEWRDRRGKVIRDRELPESAKRQQPGSLAVQHKGERVEVWDDDEGSSTVLRSSAGHEAEAVHATLTEAELEKELAAEKQRGLSLLDDLFGAAQSDDEMTDARGAAQLDGRRETTQKSAVQPLVKRYDPEAADDLDEDDASMADNAKLGNDHDMRDAPATNGETSTSASRQDDESDDEEDFVPMFGQSDTQQDLTSIFKPSVDGSDKRTFSLFGNAEDNSDIEDDTFDAPAQNAANANLIAIPVQRDRLSRQLAVEDDGAAAAAAAKAAERSRKLLLSTPEDLAAAGAGTGAESFWATSMAEAGAGWLHPTTDTDRARAAWEARRGDATREWKRKRKDALKRLRKRHGT